MIELLRIEDYQDLVDCRSSFYQSRESFLKCSFAFLAGKSYGVVSDFGCGSWGLVTCLAGRGTENHSGTIFLNGKAVPFNGLLPYSCFISENVFPAVNSAQNLSTPEGCIKKALCISGQPYSVSEIKEIFHLSDGRFERSLDLVSGEIWQISAAINFSLGKEVFCYPWLNELDISRFEIACESGTIDFLKRNGKIILVPSSQEKKLKKLCDHTLKFSHGKFSFS